MKTNEILLELISKNASVNEICSITGLSPKQLFYRLNMLKIKGYDFEKNIIITEILFIILLIL